MIIWYEGIDYLVFEFLILLVIKELIFYKFDFI